MPTNAQFIGPPALENQQITRAQDSQARERENGRGQNKKRTEPIRSGQWEAKQCGAPTQINRRAQRQQSERIQDRPGQDHWKRGLCDEQMLERAVCLASCKPSSKARRATLR